MINQIQQIVDKIYQINVYIAIVAHGDFPKEQYLIDKIKSAKKIICCDGAIINLLKYNIIPDYIIGDCDSISEEIANKFANKIIKIQEQQNNDLTKAVNFVIEKLHETNIVIFAATGLREDHTLGNISLLIKYAKLTSQIAILSDYGIFTVHAGYAKILSLKGQQVSIFSTNPNTRLTTTNLKWDLNNYQLDSWYNGTLNQALDDDFTLGSDGVIIVYRAFVLK